MSEECSFVCTKCGACCRHLEQFPGEYADLDRGDGVCRYYDAQEKLCSIYTERPLKCRIEESYEIIYQKKMTRNEYYRLMSAGCTLLKQLDTEQEAVCPYHSSL